MNGGLPDLALVADPSDLGGLDHPHRFMNRNHDEARPHVCPTTMT
jgi:hypothetical protein